MLYKAIYYQLLFRELHHMQVQPAVVVADKCKLTNLASLLHRVAATLTVTF